MRLTWDEAKRIATLTHRGLDFAEAAKVFAGDHLTAPDDRRDYCEPRYITAGWLDGRFVVRVVDAPRQQSADHFDEGRTCRRGSPVSRTNGLIATTRRA
jgi:uncharacterized DUF497 family protein